MAVFHHAPTLFDRIVCYYLFRGRYKAILADADPYAGELSRYIHLNPVRAGIAKMAEQYPWASYAAYINKTATPRWCTTDWLLQYFGNKTTDARKAYRYFVESAMTSAGEDPLKEATSSLILGRGEFIDDIREKYLGDIKKGRDLPALKELTKTSLEAIIKAVGQEFRDESEYARKVSIYLSHRYSGRRLREIGEEFRIGESAVSQASKRFEGEMVKSRSVRRNYQGTTHAYLMMTRLCSRNLRRADQFLFLTKKMNNPTAIIAELSSCPMVNGPRM